MYCKKCGFYISSQDQVCPNCAEINEFYMAPGVSNPVPPVAPVEPVAPQPTPVDPTIGQPQVAPQPQPVQEQPTFAQPEPNQFQQPQPSPVAQPTPQPEPAVGINQAPIAPIEKKKKNKGFIVLIIILLLIIAGLGAFIGFKLLNGENSGNGSSGTGGNTGGGDIVKPEPVQKNDRITVDGVEFTIPSGYVKKVVNGYNMIVDSTNGVMFYVEGLSNEGTYEEFKAEFKKQEANFKSSFESSTSGATYIGMSEYTVNGHNYFSVAASAQGLITEFTITSIVDDYIAVSGIIYTEGNKEIAYKSLDTFLHTGKKANANSFAPTVTLSNITEDVKAYTKIE